MKHDVSKEWCMAAAQREADAGDPDCGAGRLAQDPVFDFDAEVKETGRQYAINNPSATLEQITQHMRQALFDLMRTKRISVRGEKQAGGIEVHWLSLIHI